MRQRQAGRQLRLAVLARQRLDRRAHRPPAMILAVGLTQELVLEPADLELFAGLRSGRDRQVLQERDDALVARLPRFFPWQRAWIVGQRQLFGRQRRGTRTAQAHNTSSISQTFARIARRGCKELASQGKPPELRATTPKEKILPKNWIFWNLYFG